MPPPKDRLSELAYAALSAIEAYYAADGTDLPARRLVAPGSAAALPFDCELLAVNVERTFGHEGNIAGETIQPILAHVGFALRGASLSITLIRCCPTVEGAGVYSPPRIPTAPAEQAAAFELLEDAMLLTSALTARGAMPTYCNGVALENWRPIGPTGGFGGGLLTVRVDLA